MRAKKLPLGEIANRHLKPRDETEGDKTERLEENSHAELGPTIKRPDTSTGRNIHTFSANA